MSRMSAAAAKALPFNSTALIPLSDGLDMSLKQTHFELFDLPQTFTIDTAKLDRQYRLLQSEVHPDRFAASADSERRLSLQYATQANEAYQTLKNPLTRARYLLQLKGIDTQEESNTAMPVDFLMQQMEWREALEEASKVANADDLEALKKQLLATEKSLQSILASALDDDHDDIVATETVRKLRFIDKAQQEVDQALEVLESLRES
jgi:molecular chaperone HscB